MKALDSDHNEIVIKELEDEEEGFDRSQSEESEGERAALPTDGKGGRRGRRREEEAGDDFDTDDDVFDFDDVPSFEISPGRPWMTSNCFFRDINATMPRRA